MASTRRRVKLYVLNEDRQWDDRGTGHVSSSYVESLQGMSIMVRSEEDGSILLESRIQSHTAYQKQQETLIVWSEGENYDLALSFQEKAGCDEIWEKICQVQGKDPSVTITQDIPEEDDSEERFEEVLDSAGPIELPSPELSKLEEISELFSGVLPSPIRREKLALSIEQEQYIRKLIDIFHMCEDLENLDGLHHIFDIFKTMILLNKPSLLEILFADDLLLDVVGCLEYDPNASVQQKHRHFLKETAKFQEVIPITNSEILSKIHQTFRVQYIYDVILPPPTIFEENMLASVGSFIFFNKIEIVNHLQEDEKFLADLFSQIVDEDTPEVKRRKLVCFLKEFVSFSQHLQHHQKDEFFKALTHHGFLSAVEILMASDIEEIKLASIELFSQLVEVSPYMVREFVMHEAKTLEEDMLINHIIDQMICDGDTGNAYQLTQLVRTLLDPENMALGPNKMEKSEFLSFFYKHCMHMMTAPLFAATTEEYPSKDDYVNSVTLGHVLELLTFCVEHHAYHIKNCIISKDLLKRVLVLMKSKHKFLVLSALRFFRRIVGLKDEFYNRYIIKGKLFEPVVQAFKDNGHKYNLLNSAIVELFEFIRAEDVKTLCTHVAEEYTTFFKDVDYVSTFSGLMLRYEQEQDRLQNSKILDRQANHGIIHVNSRYRRDARAMDEDEEMWFDQDESLENGEEAVVPQQDPNNSADPAFKSRKTLMNHSDNKGNKVSSNSTSSSSLKSKKMVMALVDYPDDDEDDDDDDEPLPLKRQRLNAS